MADGFIAPTYILATDNEWAVERLESNITFYKQQTHSIANTKHRMIASMHATSRAIFFDVSA
jgi:hypothetical protein